MGSFLLLAVVFQRFTAAMRICCCPFNCTTFFSAAAVAGMLWGLRVIPLEYWCAIVLGPAVLYALLAEKTNRTRVRGFSKMLYWDLKEHGIGVTLLSPAEIEGTDYFKNEAGKAGGDSHNRIPLLFQLVGKLGLNYTTNGVAWAGMNAVENDWSIANVPCYLAHAFVVCNGLIPFFIESMINCGWVGKRSGSKAGDQEMAAP